MDALQQLNLAAPIADTFNALEMELLCYIAKQLSGNSEQLINASSKWRITMLAQMGKLNKDTAKIIAGMVQGVPGDVEGIIQTAINEALAEHGLEMSNSISDSVNKALENYDRQAVKSKYNQVNTVMQYKAKQAYVNGVNKVADRFDRIQQKALDNAQEYLDILNKNAMEVVLGEKSRTEALRQTIGEMCDKGIPAFVDASGREWSPEAYVNMDIRNTAKNAALVAEFASLDELGQDIILVTSHSGARPGCYPYQGKLYSRSGKSGTITDLHGKKYTYKPLSSTSFGEPDGLFGINCGHRFRGVSDGLFVNREKEYEEGENSEEYAKVQKQRQMERQIRKDKTKKAALEAAGDKEGAKEIQRKITAENKQLRAYCEKEGLSYRQDRTKVYGYEKKGIDNGGESGIIKENPQGLVKTELHSLGTINLDKYKNITDKRILTNEVIITDNRIEHIIQRRGQSFYDEYHGYFGQILKDPDFIFKDTKEDTAVVSKRFVHKGKTVNLVLRVAVEGDDPTFKNSIITAVGESEKRFAQRLRNNSPVYKKVDTDE